jgi:hypothetical protein
MTVPKAELRSALRRAKGVTPSAPVKDLAVKFVKQFNATQ